MPGLLNQSTVEFKNINIQKLHPTFGALISGVDFSSPVSDEVFNEILAAITKVRRRVPNSDKRHFYL